MALYSKSLDNMLLTNRASYTATDVSFANAASTLARASGNFMADGFRPGDVIEVSGSDSGTNDGYHHVASISADGATLTLTTAPTDETAGEEITVKQVCGKNLADIFKGGVMAFYTGTPPTNADVALPGTKAVELTDGGGAFTIGQLTNGIDLTDQVSSNGELDISVDIEGDGIAPGQIRYAVLFDNYYDEDESPDGARIIFSVGSNSGEVSIGSGGLTAAVGSKHKVQSIRLFYQD